MRIKFKPYKVYFTIITCFAQNFIQESSNTNMALRCEGIPCEAMAFSNFGVYCIRWLRSFSSSLSALRHSVCSAIFKEAFGIAESVGRDEDYLKSASSWLDFLILSDSLLWKCKSYCFDIWTFEIKFLSCVRIFMVH